jgi:DNA polymerase III delta prime subunit
MSHTSDQFIWVEKYRPRKIQDTILPDHLKSKFNTIIKNKEIPNMIFSGTAGVGKTTVARALCEELGLDYIIINGSEEGNIDTLRGKIKQFASTVSLGDNNHKVVILDEADYLNPQSTQPALRGFIEQFSDNCRFILTCNFKNRIIEPLHSRCPPIEFIISPQDRPAIAGQIFKSVADILTKENVPFDNKVVAEFVSKYFPDFRRLLNELQQQSMAGKIDAGSLASVSGGDYKQLFVAIKDKNFKTMRAWVANNSDMDTTAIFRAIYDQMNDYVEPQSIPQLVLILADYQYKNSFVADHELNMVACMTEIMANIRLK